MRRWLGFSKHVFWATLIALVLILAPCAFWSPNVFRWWQVPLVILGLILYTGVKLFDTFFYDRYQ
jgi:hypothetical protein